MPPNDVDHARREPGRNCCCRQTTLISLLPVKGAAAWQTNKNGRDLRDRADGRANRDGRDRKVILASGDRTARAASPGHRASRARSERPDRRARLACRARPAREEQPGRRDQSARKARVVKPVPLANCRRSNNCCRGSISFSTPGTNAAASANVKLPSAKRLRPPYKSLTTRPSMTRTTAAKATITGKRRKERSAATRTDGRIYFVPFPRCGSMPMRSNCQRMARYQR